MAEGDFSELSDVSDVSDFREVGGSSQVSERNGYQLQFSGLFIIFTIIEII